jgi:hypothetical protein
MSRRKSKYGVGHFLLDCLLIICTGGLWLFWIVFRYMHRSV